MKALRRELEQGGVPMSAWRKSSFSDTPNSCVEVRHKSDVVYVRDSKIGEDSPVLRFAAASWLVLTDAIVAPRDGDPWKIVHRSIGYESDGHVLLSTSDRSPELRFDADEWKAFVYGVRAGEFDGEKLSEGVSAGSGSVAGSGEAATGAVDGSGWSSDGPGSPVPVAAELGSLDDDLDTLISPGSCGCTEMVADAACTEHGMKAFLRALLSIEDSPAGRLAGRGSLLPASTPDDPRSGGQPGPYVAEITWSEDPSLGEPQGPPAGRPVDVSADEVDLSAAGQPGSEDAAGTGVPPDPVPAAQPRVWSLAEEPGADVTAVKDAEASVWNRAAEYHCRACNRWSPDWDPDVEIEWSPLLVEYGPLTDATPAAAPLVPTDGAL